MGLKTRPNISAGRQTYWKQGLENRYVTFQFETLWSRPYRTRSACSTQTNCAIFLLLRLYPAWVWSATSIILHRGYVSLATSLSTPHFPISSPIISVYCFFCRPLSHSYFTLLLDYLFVISSRHVQTASTYLSLSLSQSCPLILNFLSYIHS